MYIFINIHYITFCILRPMTGISSFPTFRTTSQKKNSKVFSIKAEIKEKYENLPKTGQILMYPLVSIFHFSATIWVGWMPCSAIENGPSKFQAQYTIFLSGASIFYSEKNECYLLERVLTSRKPLSLLGTNFGHPSC